MHENNHSVVILLAEDDEDDYLLFKDALEEVGLQCDLRWVKEGEELMDYLVRRGRYAKPEKSPRPSLIVLDLNMPKMDGRLALKQIKGDPRLRQIPVVALTTSTNEADLYQTYDSGVNSLIRKPLSYEVFVEIARELKRYWFEIVQLPSELLPQSETKSD